VLATVLGSYLFAASADAGEIENILKVNSSVRVDAERQVGDVSSVNGGIDLARGALARDVHTVNGGIDLSDNVEIDSAETVNGGIRVGTDVKVNGSLETVNGGIRTDGGTVIEDRVRTVNGKIRLHETHVGRDVQTSNGDIELRNNTVVEGDLIVKGRQSWFGRLFNFNHRPPTITVDGSSAIHGDIHLHREAELNIDENAEVGDIIRHY